MKVKCYCGQKSDTTRVFVGNKVVLTADSGSYLSISIGQNSGKKSDVRLIVDKNDNVKIAKGLMNSDVVVWIWDDQKHFILNKVIDHAEKD